MLSFMHSGTSGDLLSSLPAIRHLGGGRLLLRLNNTRIPGRMSMGDLAFLAPLILQTGYVTEFREFRPNDVVDHDLDKFRNYLERAPYLCSLIGLHFLAVGKMDFMQNRVLQREAYLHRFLQVPTVRSIQDKYVGVSRTPRHRRSSPEAHYFWQRMIDDGLGEVGVFFGLPQEHQSFENTFKTKIQFMPTSNGLALAEYIAGVECFVTSSTMNYWIATGLQKTTILETRQKTDIGQPHKWSDNECNNHRPHGLMIPFANYMN
jgi:hypothetical protein